MWGNCFVTSLKWLLLFQPGEEILPTDEDGKLILDSVDLRHTWEVSPGKRKPGEEPGDREPPHFFHLWEWAVDHQTQQFMNLRAGMLGLWGGNHCWNVYIEERNGKFWTMKTMHFSFHVICLLCFFMEEMAILQLMCWLSSVFSSWYSMLVLERDRVYWFFQHLFLFYCPFQVTVHHPSLPGPGEV